MEWIDKQERLPEETGFYLTWVDCKEDGGFPDVIWFNGDSKLFGERYREMIAYWQPITPPVINKEKKQ